MSGEDPETQAGNREGRRGSYYPLLYFLNIWAVAHQLHAKETFLMWDLLNGKHLN